MDEVEHTSRIREVFEGFYAYYTPELGILHFKESLQGQL